MTQKNGRKISKIPSSDISELMSLIYEIKLLVQNYSHVSDYIPNSITESINNLLSELRDEQDRRIVQHLSKFK